MNIQPILNIAEICFQKGIKHAVISPGSRSAPITLGFANHTNIDCKIINDERSAAFIAMGMALQLNETVALVCTSGTAALNYAPAIAEAYYQQIPLLVITADRPPELIDQQDGQCLHQNEIYKNYIKSSYYTPDSLKTDVDCNHFYRIINDAINDTTNCSSGPVHINVPIREPFYPEKNIEFTLNEYQFDSLVKTKTTPDFTDLITKICTTNHILFIAGQQRINIELENLIQKLVDHNYPVIADINSNLTSVKNVIQMEEIIFQDELKTLHPEIVITFGNSILSKKLKQYFRKSNIEHYHIAETTPTPNFFGKLVNSYQCKPLDFLDVAIKLIKRGNDNFNKFWLDKNLKINTQKNNLLNSAEYSEPTIINNLLKTLPSNSNIHLANSMAVRWLNIIGVDPEKQFNIQSNRGVSGIDGSTSTSLGYSIYSNQNNFLITGDISFFYDRNAFWNNYIPKKFKIILLNNHEGGIFNMIPGPDNIKETLSYFTSSQNLTARSLANEFDLDYFYVESKNNIDLEIEMFLSSRKCSIIEFKTDSNANKKALNLLKDIK